MTALDILKRDEGLRLKPYHCPAGKLTIGYGRNIEDNGITKTEAEYLLSNDFEQAKLELRSRYPFTLNLSTVRFDILAMMVFNMGINRFSKFQKMLRAVEAGDIEKVIKEMLDSKWAKQVGLRAIRLSEMYRNDRY